MKQGKYKITIEYGNRGGDVFEHVHKVTHGEAHYIIEMEDCIIEVPYTNVTFCKIEVIEEKEAEDHVLKS